MGVVRKREAARRDLVAHFVYLAEEAGLDTADGFLKSAESTFTDLSLQPYSGTLVVSSLPELQGIRRWRVRDFENWLIFYLPTQNGVSIIRVLHATQDWWSLLSVTD
ncbi:hypothetical protein ABENE_09985 [Asticcacaulis benevestitus DSM 16100 = ATCC BAA-896]|uniref:Plasmid stabilization protein n=2 Tax=Asticcacaulis TaxID=76890 RepID=V4PTL4_9CAUL|nr:hypothetical protein ABENE_09985 [Asticcacaulis benevestitus DSM 16100 = ATCC BAA-896]